jgi:hypothetical protein
MAQLVTITLPEALASRAREAASRSNRPLEEILLQWLDQASGESPVDLLPDSDVLALTKLQMDQADDEELSDLLDALREREITPEGHLRLDELMTIYRRGLLLKSEALRVAVERGLRPPLS